MDKRKAVAYVYLFGVLLLLLLGMGINTGFFKPNNTEMISLSFIDYAGLMRNTSSNYTVITEPGVKTGETNEYCCSTVKKKSPCANRGCYICDNSLEFYNLFHADGFEFC